jgi:hypothetical protein
MRLAATEPLFAPPDLRPLALEVFTAISRARFASIPSLLAFAGASGLTEELVETWLAAGLLHLGVAVTDPIRGTQLRYVAITAMGARELARTTIARIEGVSAARLKRSSQKRAHDVAVGDFALTVLALARDHGLELLGVETDDKKFATSIVLARPGEAPRRVALQADLYLAVSRPTGPTGLLVEIDRGTISPERMGEKYRGYLAWSRAGGPERDFSLKALRVLTVVPDDRRMEKLHAAALEANEGRRSGFLVFLKAEDASPREPLRLMEPIVRLTGEDGAHIPLFTSEP